tara:strand:- start:11177 stop:11926 length:750 start_codon:yes stop_codon:yes gene_type:complete
MVILPLSGRRFIAALVTLGGLSGCANPPPADARDTVPEQPLIQSQTSEIDAHIAEASQRFRIPEAWIRAVMRAESAGNPRAVSRAGAMGLMQIMPGTWGDLRAAHRLGTDPFDRRDNIIGGTAYLRQMYDRFGPPGFLAAYNAGPGRYAEHLRTGRPLPRETRAYVTALSRVLGFSNAAPVQTPRSQTAPRWQTAPLFAPASSAPNVQADASAEQLPEAPTQVPQRAADPQTIEPAHPLFVSRTEEEDR